MNVKESGSWKSLASGWWGTSQLGQWQWEKERKELDCLSIHRGSEKSPSWLDRMAWICIFSSKQREVKFGKVEFVGLWEYPAWPLETTGPWCQVGSGLCRSKWGSNQVWITTWCYTSELGFSCFLSVLIPYYGFAFYFEQWRQNKDKIKYLKVG